MTRLAPVEEEPRLQTGAGLGSLGPRSVPGGGAPVQGSLGERLGEGGGRAGEGAGVPASLRAPYMGVAPAPPPGPLGRPWGPGAALGLAVLARLLVGLHPHSGEGRPPMFGDYEAQRHWMEVTLGLPLAEWYRGAHPQNDLQYWGLDYPPLTAYQSYACGRLVALAEPAAVALGASRGWETPSSKRLLRLSVVLFDVLVLFPAVWFAARAFASPTSAPAPAPAASSPSPAQRARGGAVLSPRQAHLCAFVLLQPALLLIDHGHFQYNNISLGFSLGAAAAIARGRPWLGSALFCLALNHKQMALYFAPAFFAHLLGRALRRPGGAAARLTAVAGLGFAVVATFGLVWAPFLWPDPEAALAALRRLAPLQRGLFEDYVANFWCASHPLFRWKERFEVPTLVRTCTLATLAAFLPSVAHQVARPSRRGLLYGMANSAWAFFLFSFQVHEKSVLLPLLPAVALAAYEPLLAQWLACAAPFSMFPLLKRDGLQLAYWGCLGGFLALLGGGAAWAEAGARVRRAAGLSAAGALALHAAEALFEPPARLPFLFDYAFTGYAFAHLAAFALYTNWKQWQLEAGEPDPVDERRGRGGGAAANAARGEGVRRSARRKAKEA